MREFVWHRLEEHRVVKFPKPARGRIPNFIGSESAAKRLRTLPAYRSAKTLMINPDSAQMAVRELALRDGKKLLMASPRLKTGFILLDPKSIRNPREAATIKGAFKHGERVKIKNLKIDLIVQGSVAVDRSGGRVGKGGGFGDLEIAILMEAGAATDATPIVTTVHPLQIVENVPMTEHDVPVDVIITPDEVIEVEQRYPKPSGIHWDLLSPESYQQMPILEELRCRG